MAAAMDRSGIANTMHSSKQPNPCAMEDAGIRDEDAAIQPALE
jgi:hypothetical protein